MQRSEASKANQCNNPTKRMTHLRQETNRGRSGPHLFQVRDEVRAVGAGDEMANASRRL